MARTKTFDGLEYVFFARRSKLTTARKLAQQLRNMGKSARVHTINSLNHDIYVR